MDAISGGIQSLDLDEKPKATTASSGTAGDDHGGAGSLRSVENVAETGSGRGETEDGRQEENVEQKLETDGDGGKKGSDVGKVGPLTEEEEEEDDKVLLYRQRYGKKGSEVNRDAGKVAPLPEEEEEGMKKVLLYPQRYGELDCAYYMKTGRCAYGVNCRFNHPPRTGENNQVTSADSSEPVQAANNMLSEEHLEGQQVECRYYLMPGGCKFGKACRYGHSRQMPEEQSVMLNFLGLPLRPGQKECPYYMRSGSCRFSSNCRFNHPDPIAAERRDSPSGYQNAGGSHHYVSISSRPPSNFSQGTLSRNVSLSNASPSYLPSLPSQPKGLGLNPKVKDYQPHAKPSFSSTSLDGTAMNFENYANKHLQMEYPERPGQPECPSFMKTKDCKFRSACKFHHPRSRLSEVSICNLSSCGLPLRPDKEICAFYGRFGICKYGPACKFHHPLDFTATSTAAKSSGDSSGSDNYRIEEVRMGDNKNLVEQSA